MKRANSWGLFDMLGNVAECCLDYWHESYQGAPTDGSAWLNPEGMRGVDRVMRGAAWNNNARKVRSAYRRPIDWEARAINVGFRCVRVQRDDEVGG
jgi:formylglycine-generating enzyme required for sulfatase activity